MSNPVQIETQPTKPKEDDFATCSLGIRRQLSQIRTIDAEFRLPDNTKCRVIYDDRYCDRKVSVNIDGQIEVEAEQRFPATWKDRDIEVKFPDQDTNVLAYLKINGSTEIIFNDDGSAKIKGATLICGTDETTRIDES